MLQMKKAKEDRGDDRLSELHDSLLFDIFKLMPTIDVVRTTILSKRWKNLWKTVPWLDFDDITMKYRDKFRDFVNGALNSWRGAKISSFIVKFRFHRWKSVTHEDINSWVLFATKKKVEDLKLYLPGARNKRPYLVPDCLYLCSSLKKVELRSCDVRMDGNMVQWDQLQSLRIDGGRCPSGDAINLVLSKNPKLVYLSLATHSLSNEVLNIRSSSLKRLVIIRTSLMDERELRIWTPNLERLTIGGFPLSKCMMMNVASLTKARLYLYDSIHIDVRMVPQIQTLPVLEHVERLQVSDWCIEELIAMKEKSMASPFPNARFLELQYYVTHDYGQILCFLGMFPRLRDLVIHTNLNSPRSESEENRVKFDRNNFPDSFLMHLRTVDITWTIDDESMFPLRDCFLKYARNLEKMVIWEKGEPRKLLLKMERSPQSHDEFKILEVDDSFIA